MPQSWSFGSASVDDLFEMAAMVEQGGFDFYARLTSRSLDPRVRNELRFLRDEEAVHKAWFLEQLRARGGAPGGKLPPDLQAVLESRFLAPVESAFSAEAVDNESALRLGSALEQASIDFYRSLRATVSRELLPDLDRIIEEEERHLRKLETIRAF